MSTTFHAQSRQTLRVRARLWLLAAAWLACGGSASPGAEPAPASQPSGQATQAWRRTEVEDISLFELDVPTVVTASRRRQAAADLPYAVSVITAEDIRHSGARSVPDALRLAPGVDVAELAYGTYAVSPRGFHAYSANEVLVLVDSRQIFDSVYGGTLWGNWPFQLEDIERIEVVRGPGGVTWGANTLNGVINIITKDPKDQTSLTSTGQGGTQGTHKEHLGYAYSDGPLRLRVSGEYEASDGFREGGSILGTLEDDYKAGRMGVHAIYDAGPKDTLTLSVGSGLVDGAEPPSPLATIGSRQNPGSQANFFLGKWEHRFADDNRLNLTGYVNDFQHCPGIAAADYRYQQFALQLNHTFKPAENHTFTWGFDSRFDILDASYADPSMLAKNFVSTGTLGLYVQDEWQFAPRWALNLGSRIDYEFYGGFAPSARAALSHQLPDNAFVYGAVSRAFSMPPAGLRLLEIPEVFGLAYGKGSRDMDAETVITYEVGYRKRFFDRVETNLCVYWNEYDALITASPKPGPPGLVQANYDNRGEASTYGVELDAKYAVSKELTLLGHYTCQQLRWDAAVPYNDRLAVTPPKHKFMLGARYDPLPDLHLSSHLYYVDAVEAPNAANPLVPHHIARYLRLDLRAEYEFWKKQASVAVGVRNLLDANHYEGGALAVNSAEVPRMVYAEVRFAFK